MSYLPLLKPITGTWLTHSLHCSFTSPGSIRNSEGYGCSFKTSAAIAFCFSVKTSMNRSIKRFEFSLIAYTGSLLNVSWKATLIGTCLYKYVRSSIGCLLSGANIASKSYTIKWGSGVNSFFNHAFFNIGSSHSQVDTRLYFVSLLPFCTIL